MRVLVLCTGNSCRSILAEAMLNAVGEGGIEAVSAGSKPTGQVHPGALKLLESKGIPIPDARSKSWDEFAGQEFDVVLTVCDNAANETCPVFGGPARKIHWSIPDPAYVDESDSEAAFDTAFEMIQQGIEAEILPMLGS